MSDLQSVQHDLETATTTLEDLRAAIRAGDDIDLDAFNRMVAETCHAAVSLPYAEMPQVRRQLEELLDRLNRTRDEITEEQERIAAEIDARGFTMPPVEPIDEAQD
jgi:hypothetical protein